MPVPPSPLFPTKLVLPTLGLLAVRKPPEPQRPNAKVYLGDGGKHFFSNWYCPPAGTFGPGLLSKKLEMWPLQRPQSQKNLNVASAEATFVFFCYPPALWEANAWGCFLHLAAPTGWLVHTHRHIGYENHGQDQRSRHTQTWAMRLLSTTTTAPSTSTRWQVTVAMKF